MKLTTYNQFNQRMITFLIMLTGLLLMGHSSIHANDSGQTSDENTRLSDKNINHFVQTELIAQDGVNWNSIDVETNQGIVTLTGTADHLLAKDRAIHIAKAVKGVRAVVDNIKVKDFNIGDQELQRDVKQALLLDPATDSYEVNVKATNGSILLKGKVDSWQEKMLSDMVSRSVKGVKEVENNIYFDLKENRSDLEIKEDILQSLKWDIRVDDAFIDVIVNDGKVTLSGTVGSVAEESQAKVNAWVAGVKSVDTEDLNIAHWASDNEIRKKQFIAKSDWEIKQAVKDAFLYDPRVSSFNPDVTVSNGAVTLTGHVDNLKAKKAAERDARNVIGVWKVENQLKVKTESYQSDEIIKSSVNNALRLNPFVEGYEIKVMAQDGKVTLTGTVDNYQEKYEAEEVVSGVYGVTEVKNRLITDLTANPFAFDLYSHNYYPYGTKIKNHYAPVKSDQEIKDDIKNQLWWSPYVDLSDVNITVDNGTAELSGKVDSWREYNYAEKNAYDGGAFFVENDLIVDYNK